MKDTVNQEQELEKNDDLTAETPNSQSQESAQADKKDSSPAEETDKQDPIKKLQDELAEAKDKFVRMYA